LKSPTTWAKHGKWLAPLVRLKHYPLAARQANGPEDMEAGENFEQKKHVVQAIQPSILKHKNGKLQVLCRTRNGKVLRPGAVITVTHGHH
jgi:alpha-L-rhamnosidase